MSKKDKQLPNSNRPNPKKPQRPGGSTSYVWFILAILLGFWVFSSEDGLFGTSQTISYSTFQQHLDDGNLKEVVVKGEEVQGTFKEPQRLNTSEQDTTEQEEFVTYLPSFGTDALLDELEESNVEVTVLPQSDINWWTMLIWGLPFLFLLFIGLHFFRQMRAQGQPFMNIGQSKAKLQDAEKAKTTFDDVAGLSGAKTELREIVGFLKNPEQFDTLGGEVPRGVLLVGPPGTGKTLLARAVSGEAGVPFFTITGSDFMEMFVGVGAKRVRDMFKKAKEASPSIIFIDEIDSIGRKRGAGLGGGHDEREQTLNQMLSELDGFETNEGVIVMAATNRPDILDKALLRPGRFDRQVTVHLPTQEHRKQILEIHARNKKLAEDIDLEEIARSTPGFSGADLNNLLNEAALIAARKKQKQIEQEDIDQARDKVMMGLKREGIKISDKERQILAYHEAGHAIVAATLPNADPLHKVTIIPRGRAMGVTQQLPQQERMIYEKKYMLDRMAVIMGGRAAESLIFDTSTSGAENDLKQITKIARKMVLDWGMSENFGNMAFGDEQEQVFLGDEISRGRNYSDNTAREIDEEVKKILQNAYKKAEDLLKKYKKELDRVAEMLLEHEEIPGKKVIDLISAAKDQNGSIQTQGKEG